MHQTHNLVFYEAVVGVIPVLFLALLVQREWDKREPPSHSAGWVALYANAPLLTMAGFISGEAYGLRVLYRGTATSTDAIRVTLPLYLAMFSFLTPILIPYSVELYEPVRGKRRAMRVVGVAIATLPFLIVMGAPLAFALHYYV